jgi:predicted metal-dependent hydrolase
VNTADVRTLTVDGVTLRATIVRKRVRNINVRLVDDELRVSAPHRVSRAELDEVVEKLARRLVRRARAELVNADDRAIEVASRVASRFPEPPAVTDIRFVTNQHARWGSYSPTTGVVRINAALRHLPSWVLEAVVAHELVHAFHPDHSTEFWRLLRRVCPGADRAKTFLEGVSWISERWDDLPPVERSQLSGKQNSEFGIRNSHPQIRNPECGARNDGIGVNTRLPFEVE